MNTSDRRGLFLTRVSLIKTHPRRRRRKKPTRKAQYNEIKTVKEKDLTEKSKVSTLALIAKKPHAFQVPKCKLKL